MMPVVAALLRTDLRYFIQRAFATVFPGSEYLSNWHIDAIAHQLMRVHDGDCRRLLINQPPRSLKSLSVSVAFVAWLLGHDPSRRIIVVSYASELSAELHRQFRMVIESGWYQELFPAMRPAKDTGTELVTTTGGSRYATTVGGTLTGRGADLIIIDDPLKAEEAMLEPGRNRVTDWFGGTLVSRLNEKQTGCIIVVMQRLHEDDLAGHLLQAGGWHHLDLPAIAVEDSDIPIGKDRVFRRRTGDLLHPRREGKPVLERIKAEIGSLQFSAQYQQRPVPLERNLIKRDWFCRYDQLPAAGASGYVVQSWDTAMMTGKANDYSVCTTWRMIKNDYYLLDVYRGRHQYPDLRRAVAALATKYSADAVLVEDAGPGIAMLQDLQRDTPNGMPRPIGIKPEGSKADRMAAQSFRIEAGQVHLPADAPWLDDYLLALLAFPYGKHDDQVDSTSQFLKWAATHPMFDDIELDLISVGREGYDFGFP
ncbi:phage terminase large subunit [Bradyrhizobium sp. 143]|nr:phage terminase large subunit [Bradyrhizobium sp. 143]MCK1731732.1 phage terminase large subunit [Bradyrhizobium sp. 142]